MFQCIKEGYQEDGQHGDDGSNIRSETMKNNDPKWMKRIKGVLGTSYTTDTLGMTINSTTDTNNLLTTPDTTGKLIETAKTVIDRTYTIKSAGLTTYNVFKPSPVQFTTSWNGPIEFREEEFYDDIGSVHGVLSKYREDIRDLEKNHHNRFYIKQKKTQLLQRAIRRVKRIMEMKSPTRRSRFHNGWTTASVAQVIPAGQTRKVKFTLTVK